MAIATEIGRLQGAKQDLISRLKAKGVSVPQNATLEEITPLIDAISVGEDVTAETTEYTSLNAELEEVINSLPDAGGSGGASIETCTVTITGTALDCEFSYMTLDDSKKPAARYITNSTSNLTLTDVVCNSLMICVYANRAAYGAITNGTMVKQIPGSFAVMTIDAQAGETATFTVQIGGSGAE